MTSSDRHEERGEAEAAPPSGWRAAVRGNVLAMGLVSLLTDFSSEMMNPLLPLFLAGVVPVGAAALWTGLMEGVAETTAALLKLVAGRLSDRLGKRKALVAIGYGLSSVARPAIALATSGLGVVVLKFFDRVGKGLRTAPRDALIGDSVAADRRGLAFSFHQAMDHFGAVLGPVVAIAVILGLMGQDAWHGMPAGEATAPEEMGTLRWLFALAAIPGLAAMFTILLKVREMAPKKSVEGKNGGETKRGRLPRRFLLYVGAVTVFALGNSSDLFIVLLGTQLFGMGIVQVLILWIALHLAKVASSVPGGMLSDRLGRRPTIVMGWALYAGVYLGFSRLGSGDELLFWVLVVVYGLYYGLTEGAGKALVADFVPSEGRGTAFGVYHGAVAVASLPASLGFGLLWGTGSAAVAFGVGAGLAGLASVLLLVLLSSTPRRAAA